jgi:hypothetical protein
MIYYAIGNELVSESNLVQKTQEYEAQIDTLSGAGIANTSDSIEKFQPIGLGKPLQIRICEVYTGKFSTGIFPFAKNWQLLVASAVKDELRFQGVPWALNYFFKDVEPKTHLVGTAIESGTPIIYYTPVVKESRLLLSMVLNFDSPDHQKPILNLLSQLSLGASAIPIFAPMAPYLVVGGAIFKVAHSIGEFLTKGEIEFQADIELNVTLPEQAKMRAGYALLIDRDDDNLDSSLLTNYHIKGGKLVDKSGNAYSGDRAYVVISLDGRENQDLEKFAPTAVCTNLLNQFFAIGDSQQVKKDVLEMFYAFNDLRSIQRMQEIQQEMDKPPTIDANDTEKRQRLMVERDFLQRNLHFSVLKPSFALGEPATRQPTEVNPSGSQPSGAEEKKPARKKTVDAKTNTKKAKPTVTAAPRGKPRGVKRAVKKTPAPRTKKIRGST